MIVSVYYFIFFGCPAVESEELYSLPGEPPLPPTQPTDHQLNNTLPDSSKEGKHGFAVGNQEGRFAVGGV